MSEQARLAAVILAALVAGPAAAEPDGAGTALGSPRNGWLHRRAAALGEHLGRCWDRPDVGRARDWIAFGLLAGAALGLELGTEPPRDARWTARNDFDDGIRRGLRGGSRSARDSAAAASDALFGAIGATLIGDWLYHCGAEADDEYFGLLWSVRNDGSWFLANFIATDVAKVAAGRERPYVLPCESNPGYVSNCNSGRDDNASFWSGHASGSATLAGLLCARHLRGPEVTRTDALLCGLPAAGALATGLLRITADQHFGTDLLAGWASAALFGYLLPSQLSYDPRRRGTALRPLPVRDGAGLELVFTF